MYMLFRVLCFFVNKVEQGISGHKRTWLGFVFGCVISVRSDLRKETFIGHGSSVSRSWLMGHRVIGSWVVGSSVIGHRSPYVHLIIDGQPLGIFIACISCATHRLLTCSLTSSSSPSILSNHPIVGIVLFNRSEYYPKGQRIFLDMILLDHVESMRIIYILSNLDEGHRIL